MEVVMKAVMEAHAIDYREALRKCQEGRFSSELRLLYQTPNREQVPWDLFPTWAHPNDPVEGGHEGGSL
jgi:hypothetical protein